MPKLKEDFECVPNGEIHPVVLPAGSECPAELIGNARALGILETDEEAALRGEQEREEARIAAEIAAKVAKDQEDARAADEAAKAAELAKASGKGGKGGDDSNK